MNNTIMSIISDAAVSSGFLMTDEFYGKELFFDKEHYFCTPKMKKISFSSKIYSPASIGGYTIEATSCVKVRLIGLRCNSSDFIALNNKTDAFIDNLFAVENIIITDIIRGELIRNPKTERLESELIITFVTAEKYTETEKVSVSVNNKFRVNLGTGVFYADKVIKAMQTTVSDIPVIDEGFDRRIINTDSAVITIEGKTSPDSKTFFTSLISSLSAGTLTNASIDGITYSSLHTVKASCIYSENSLCGRFVIILKEIKEC